MSALADFLTAPIEPLKTLVDLFDRFLQVGAARRRATFENFIRPTHEALMGVHEDYSGVLRRLELSMSILMASEQSEPHTVEESKRIFNEARSQREHIRDGLRIHAREFLTILDGDAERRFLYSVLMYFLPNDHRPFEDEDEMDNMIEEVLEKGGNSALNTPTTRVWSDIVETIDPHTIHSAAEVAINQLNMRLSDVARAYAKLLKRTADETTT